MSINPEKQVSAFVMEVEMIQTIIADEDADEQSEPTSDSITIDPTENAEGDNGTT